MRTSSVLAISFVLWSGSAVGQVLSEVGSQAPDLSDQVAAGFTSASTALSHRLTYQSGESVNPRVVVDADFLYVVWEDTRDGNRDIFWQKFDRWGASIHEPVNVSNTAASSVNPAVGVDGAGNCRIVWLEGPPYGTVYGQTINANGDLVGVVTAISPGLSMHPDISVLPSGISWVAFDRWTATDHDVYMRKFDANWLQSCERRLNAGTLPPFEKTPAVCASGTEWGYPAWRDMSTMFQDAIYLREISPSCGLGNGGAFLSGAYVRPDIGWSGQWRWIVAEQGGNVYNLHGSGGATRINDVVGGASYPRVGEDPSYAYVTWQDTRDGNSEVYLSLAYSNQSHPDLRITDDPASSQRPDVAMRNAEPGKWWIVWQDNRDGNWEIYLAFDQPPVTLTVKDRNGLPILTSDCVVTRIRGNGPARLTEEHTTDANGQVVFADLVPGDSIFARRQTSLVTPDGATGKPLHVGNHFFQSYEENTNPDLSYDVYSEEMTEIVLDRVISRIHLVAAFDYDVSQSEAELLEECLDTAANRFWNATNGQFWIDSVTILDDVETPRDYSGIDLLIARPERDPGFQPKFAFPVTQEEVNLGYFPPEDLNKSIPELSGAGVAVVKQYLAYRRQYMSVTYSRRLFESATDDRRLGASLPHELGHYLWNLGDEVNKRIRHPLCYPFERCTVDPTEDSASIMSYWTAKLGRGEITEFCNDENHHECNDLDGWVDLWTDEYSCWEAIDFLFDGLTIVHGSADVVFGPRTRQQPRYGVDPALPAVHSFPCRLNLIRSDATRESERGNISISRDGHTLTINASAVEFDAGQERLPTEEWIGLKTGDLIYVAAPGYPIYIIELLSEPAVPPEVLMTPLPDFVSATPSSAAYRILVISEFALSQGVIAASPATATLRLSWSGTNQVDSAALRTCDIIGGSCKLIPMTHFDDTTLVVDLPLDNDTVLNSDYLITGYVDTLPVCLASGEWEIKSATPGELTQLDNVEPYEIIVPEEDIQESQFLWAYTLIDLPVLNVGDLVAQVPPVYIASSSAASWIAPAILSATLPPGSDTMTAVFVHWDGDEWVTLTTSSGTERFYTEIGEPGLYALASTLLCRCGCHADPALDSLGGCDGITDIFDVTWVVNVAFRNSPPIPDPSPICPFHTTDVDCNGVTDVSDVIHLVNVAFRNQNPVIEFCDPCTP